MKQKLFKAHLSIHLIVGLCLTVCLSKGSFGSELAATTQASVPSQNDVEVRRRIVLDAANQRLKEARSDAAMPSAGSEKAAKLQKVRELEEFTKAIGNAKAADLIPLFAQIDLENAKIEVEEAEAKKRFASPEASAEIAMAEIFKDKNFFFVLTGGGKIASYARGKSTVPMIGEHTPDPVNTVVHFTITLEKESGGRKIAWEEPATILIQTFGADSYPTTFEWAKSKRPLNEYGPHPEKYRPWVLAIKDKKLAATQSVDRPK